MKKSRPLQVLEDLLKVEQAELLELEAIRLELRRARSATLTLKRKGHKLMPATITVGGLGAVAVFTEFTGLNGTGDVIAPVGGVTFSVDNPSVATVDQLGNVTAVAEGNATVSATDAGNSLTASDVITVKPATSTVAQSATLVLTANAPQTLAKK